MEEQILDFVLVPLGLLVMVGYHLWLIRQIIRRPATTVIGINDISRRLWARAMMQDTGKNGILAVQTFRNNIMASMVLASTAIMLSSVIAVLMSGGGGGGGSGKGLSGLIFGDRSKPGVSLKFFCILVCFLLAFLFYVQSLRYYSHASVLINVPNSILKANVGSNIDHLRSVRVTAEYVGRTVNRGSYFWSLGLRAFYFSFPLFLWVFGPIPMFVCCLVLVVLLYFLDITFDFGCVYSACATVSASGQEECNGCPRVQEAAV